MTFFDTNLRNLRYLKSYTKSTALLDVIIIRPEEGHFQKVGWGSAAHLPKSLPYL